MKGSPTCQVEIAGNRLSTPFIKDSGDKINNIRELLMKGSYTLLIELPEQEVIPVGKLGLIAFSQGFYAYVGSGMGGVEARIGRHL